MGIRRGKFGGIFTIKLMVQLTGCSREIIKHHLYKRQKQLGRKLTTKEDLPDLGVFISEMVVKKLYADLKH